MTYVFPVSFPFRRWLYRDYRLQPQDKDTMIEHRRTPFALDRARNIAAKIPISTLQCRFSDLRDWLTRTSSHVPPGKVSNEINHGHVGASISVVCARAKKFGHVGKGETIDIRKISPVPETCLLRPKNESTFILFYNSYKRARAFLSAVILFFVRSRFPRLTSPTESRLSRLTSSTQTTSIPRSGVSTKIAINDQLSPAGSIDPLFLQEEKPSLSPFSFLYRRSAYTYSRVARSDNTVNYERLYALSGAIYQLTGLIPSQIVYWKIWCVHVEHDEGLAAKGRAQADAWLMPRDH